MFSKILVAFDGSKPSLEAVESAMEIGKKYNSSIIILHVLDSYKYPYLLSSVILAPTYGSDKFEKEREKFEELMKSLRDRYLSRGDKDIETKNDGDKTGYIQEDRYDTSLSLNEPRNRNDIFETAIVEAETSTASTIVDYAESKNVDLLVIGSKGKTACGKYSD